MKKNKFYFEMILIISSIIVVAILSRFCWFKDIEKHITYYEFLTSIVIAGVTTIYVLLTYEMFENQRLDLKMRKKYIIVPDIKIVSEDLEYDFNEIQNYYFKNWLKNNLKLILKNASKYSASELNLYLLSFIRNQDKQEIGYILGRNPAIMPGETIEQNIFWLIPEVFHKSSEKETMEALKIPKKIQKYFLQQIEKRKIEKSSNFLKPKFENEIVSLYFAIQYETVYDISEIVVRDFLVFCYPVKMDKTKVTIRPSPRKVLKIER